MASYPEYNPFSMVYTVQKYSIVHGDRHKE